MLSGIRRSRGEGEDHGGRGGEVVMSNSPSFPRKPRSRLTRARATKSQQQIDQLARIVALEERAAQQDRRIAEQDERIARLQQPMVTWPSTTFPEIYDPIQSSNSCHVCGMKFEGSMGFACSRSDCPSAVVYCANGDGEKIVSDVTPPKPAGSDIRFGR